ncbi:MAG: serine--tRNA ligase [Candidatus Paceibacterota bacterium]|jgi:seryl-tRNA synthetase
MLDIKFIRENKELIAETAKNKNRDIDLDLLLRLADERKNAKQKIDELNQRRNEAANNRDNELGIQLKKDSEALDAEYAEVDKKYLELMLKVPNIYSLDTPIGKDEDSNKVIRSWGEKTNFSFQPKEHHEIGKMLGIIDTETSAEVSGSRFAYLKGDLVLMQFALLQYCLQIFTSEKKLKEIAESINSPLSIKPFIPVIPPVFIKPAVQNRMARFMSPEEHYMFPNDDLMLIGSAEHTLGPIHMDHVFAESDLPIRYVGYSTAFRREAGAHGKDTKGILRQHQFDKLEMEVFSLPENSMMEQDLLVAIQEYILQSLKLPYQVVAVCTGDMGFPDYKQIDIETWMPGQNKYRETHSADNIGGFQPRRLGTRVKRSDGKTEPIHMNDATAVAFGRTLIAIIENYQNEDGSITVPEVLRKYMGKDVISAQK